MLNGIDVSKWQLVMDWCKAKAAGVQFAIVRAGSIDATGCYEDFQFRNNIKVSAEVGIPYALYWYFRPNYSVADQVQYLVNLAKSAHLGKMAVDLWCDIEVEGNARTVKTFCDEIDKVYPTGIYTNLNTIKYLLTGDKSWMNEYPLWLADYTTPYPAPAPWSDWSVLQYTSAGNGAMYGAQSKSIDLDCAKDCMILPVVPPPPVNVEARVKQLEADMQTAFNRIVALENR
jgi:lysozyme